MTVPQFLEQHHLRSICREQSRSVHRQIVHFAVAAMQMSAAAAQSVVRLTTRGVISASGRDPKCAVHTRHRQLSRRCTVSCQVSSKGYKEMSVCLTVSCLDGSGKCAISAMCDRAVHSGRKNNYLVCAKHGPPLCVIKQRFTSASWFTHNYIITCYMNVLYVVRSFVSFRA